MIRRNEGNMNYIEELGKKAKAASRELLKIGTKTKNDVLFAIADELINKKEEIKEWRFPYLIEWSLQTAE